MYLSSDRQHFFQALLWFHMSYPATSITINVLSVLSSAVTSFFHVKAHIFQAFFFLTILQILHLSNLHHTKKLTKLEGQLNYIKVKLVIVPHIDSQTLLNKKSRLARWSIIITHWFCQGFIFSNLFLNSILFVQCSLSCTYSLFRVLIKVFLPYNIFNSNKLRKISLTNKDRSSIPFASSTPNSLILNKNENVQSILLSFLSLLKVPMK